MAYIIMGLVAVALAIAWGCCVVCGRGDQWDEDNLHIRRS